MTKILGISGKKQGGKDTTANFILGCVMKKYGFIANFKITDKGKLYCFGWANEANQDGVFDYDSTSQFVSSFKKNYLDKHIKLYSFADCLKKEICIKMLGLTWEQCYGTDEQKNSLTHLRWEDMPGIITREKLEDEDGNMLCDWCFHDKDFEESKYPNLDRCLQNTQKALARINLQYHEAGFMTARQVLQYVGTEVFRKMYGDAHVNATINQIKQDEPEYALIRDTRFINEVEGVYRAEGIVLRLLRDVFKGQDQHESETALDNYPLENYTGVIDNESMSISEQNYEIYNFLFTQGWNI